MFRLLKVCGDSLTPEYQNGDFVLVSKIPVLLNRLREGDVVAFRHLEFGVMIKRISALSPDRRTLSVIGSHSLSIDSRQFGPIDRDAVIGKVVLHISK